MSPPKQKTAGLALLALGVVYGDIGTSPLYAVKETFNPEHGIALEPANILGGASAIFWVLMIVVSLKYVTLVLRAGNRGEGGIMALLALATSSVRNRPAWTAPLMTIGVLGAALFYGDAVLTPAISVLSAIEGLEVGTAAFKPYVVWISVVVLLTLFLIQKHGTRMVGMLFGPVCALWFIAIAAAGAWNVLRQPAILQALDPRHALAFVTGHGFASFAVLGSVLLAVTGAEALYADMGHFGKSAIRYAWFGLVAPALVLNYFGQGALLLDNPKALENPFYLAFPAWALYPMVALATAATVIASQATISGAYSMTQQAIQLGYLPRMEVRHTSAGTIGQIYVPAVNWLLLAVVCAAVIGFGSSSRLASAYGVAVMGTMLATTFLTFFVIRFAWGFPLWLCVLATGAFFLIDATLLAAALLKVMDGGWFPLALGAGVFGLMTTWREGRARLFDRLRADTVPLADFLRSLFVAPPQRVAGTAVFLTATPEATPHALLHSLKHYKVLHQRVLFLTIELAEEPWIADAQRVEIETLRPGCLRLRGRFGFMEQPDVMQVLEAARRKGVDFDPMDVSFFLSREKIAPRARKVANWREQLFAVLSRNAAAASDYFNVPTNRVIELGTKVEL
jgi:KUP system potassium uptake protein